MTRSFILISGAKKNIGDFLIFEKAQELIKHHLKPDEVFVFQRSSESYDELDRINNTDAIFICGGPGYRRNFYPGTYPFLKHLDRIEVPIFPFGLGWQGEPLYLPHRFNFNPASYRVLHRIHDSIPLSTTRDAITKQILEREGVNNVENTGCPTLYDFEHMKNHQVFRKSQSVQHIVVSMAQNPLLHNQNVALLNKLNVEYPDVRKTAAFHRGLGSDMYTSDVEGAHLQELVLKTKELNFEIADLAYDLSRMRIYNEADFHVGYRVHGHAYCINQRIPSFLLWEDGRGQGMSLNLQITGVRARNPIPLGKMPLPRKLQNAVLYGNGRIPIIGRPTNNGRAVDEILKIIREQVNSNFSMFDATPDRLDFLYTRMKGFFNRVEAFLYG